MRRQFSDGQRFLQYFNACFFVVCLLTDMTAELFTPRLPIKQAQHMPTDMVESGSAAKFPFDIGVEGFYDLNA